MKDKATSGEPAGRSSTSVKPQRLETDEEAQASYERLGQLKNWTPYTFERSIMKEELMLLRPWDAKVPTRGCWVNEPWNTEAMVKLYIHEVYILCKWRRRDKNIGAKAPLIKKPDFLNYTNYYWDHLMVAQHWVNRECRKVKAMDESVKRNAFLHGEGGIVFHQEWIDQLLEKFREVNAAEAAERDGEADAEAGAEKGVEQDAKEDTQESAEVDEDDDTEDTFEDAMEE